MKVALFFAATFVAGCSSNPSNETSGAAKLATNADDGRGVICTYERLGLVSPKVERCTTVAERNALRRLEAIQYSTVDGGSQDVGRGPGGR